MDIRAGRVVISSAGHDSGRRMVVTGADGGFVFVADGKERKLGTPKKKNVKHVRATSALIELEGLTDKKLRQTLRALCPDCTLQESE
ncbi:MAG: KOW domain-containing RNA-binding protein [Oscillospiraceae bacterium]|nr:KOW domain-containing RNA-binding protein [Oscillospiraceae bacterium]